VNDADEWRKIEGIIEAQSKYVRKAWRVDLIVKYKAAAAPIDASTAPNEEVESSSEDHEGIVKEAANKKRASTTTKI
jgi:hypothetical protein